MTQMLKHKSLLLVDDDTTFCQSLGRALKRRGYEVRCAHSVEGAMSLIEAQPPEYAVFDLKLPDASGLLLVHALHQVRPDARIVMLTGYGSISTAVDAVRLGATHFLTKPANADDVVAAFSHKPNPKARVVPPKPFSARNEVEYLVRVLEDNNGNMSQTAITLGMHRRTLQRKLARFVEK